jgi:hypothetical protein
MGAGGARTVAQPGRCILGLGQEAAGLIGIPNPADFRNTVQEFAKPAMTKHTPNLEHNRVADQAERRDYVQKSIARQTHKLAAGLGGQF